MRPELARRQVSSSSKSSIRWSFTGGLVGCTMKTSEPRRSS